MTTRHTITHADELYAGNAYLQGTDASGTTVGSPDGRRGIKMPHIYVREYGAVKAADNDGIIDDNVCCLAGDASTNLLVKTAYATGALVTTVNGGTVILDVPRNITFQSAKNDAAVKLYVVGKDEYGQTMAETITGPNNTTVAGVKAFKSIHDLQISAQTVSKINVGVRNVLGLPYHLSSKGKFLGFYVNGSVISSATDMQNITTGLALACDSGTTERALDVRGTVELKAGAGTTFDASNVFTAVMVVDHSTRDKAYGVPQATAIT